MWQRHTMVCAVRVCLLPRSDAPRDGAGLRLLQRAGWTVVFKGYGVRRRGTCSACSSAWSALRRCSSGAPAPTRLPMPAPLPLPCALRTATQASDRGALPRAPLVTSVWHGAALPNARSTAAAFRVRLGLHSAGGESGLRGSAVVAAADVRGVQAEGTP